MSASDLVIREFMSADIDAVLDLNVKAWTEDDEVSRGAAYAPDLLDIANSYQKDGAFLVGLVDFEIVAMVGLQQIAGTLFELRRMRVAIEHQRRGFGLRLVGAVEERARSRGASTILLETTVQQEAAQHLYEAAGYSISHHSVLENDFGRYDVIHYKKDLNA